MSILLQGVPKGRPLPSPYPFTYQRETFSLPYLPEGLSPPVSQLMPSIPLPSRPSADFGSDTLLRHARIHKSSGDDNASRKRKTTRSDRAQAGHQNQSPSNDSSITTSSRSLVGTGMTAAIEELETPGSHSTISSLRQGHHENLFGDQPATIPTYFETPSQPQNASPQTFMTIEGPRPEPYGSEIINQAGSGGVLLAPAATNESSQAFVSQHEQFRIEEPHGSVAYGEQLDGLDSAHWLLEDDFDIGIFDRMGFSNPFFETQVIHDHSTKLIVPYPQISEKPEGSPSILDLRQMWYTQIQGPDDEPYAGSGSMTPRHAENTRVSGDDIDETYRANMANKLRPPLRDEPLPSIEFMNLCIHLFFTRFNVTLPIIHSPTFRPTHNNALLVLSICSAGCLSMGSDMAAKTGSMLFERVNKAILAAPWERALTRRSDQTWNMLKASMIGQTYALLSGDPAHRATAAAYHGSLIALARHHKLFSQASVPHLADDLSPEDLDKTWRQWAKNEELTRLALLLYLHDAEIAALFHHEPIFRHTASSRPSACSSELFSAPSATAWAVRLRAEQKERQIEENLVRPNMHTPFGIGESGLGNVALRSSVTFPRDRMHCNMLNVYTALSGIGASISECRHLNLLSFNMVNKLESDLLTWYTSVSDDYKAIDDHPTQTEVPFSFLPLWHYTFMTLSTDLQALELAVGKEGSDIAPTTREYVLSWISSVDSKRCLLHALSLQHLIVSTSMGSFIAMHIPRILFSAAVCWYCYMLYLPQSTAASDNWVSSFPDGMFESFHSLPEVRLLRDCNGASSSRGIPTSKFCDENISNLQKILVANSAETKAKTLCAIESVLRRLGPNGIASRFADIIQTFISGEAEKGSGTELLTRQGVQIAAP